MNDSIERDILNKILSAKNIILNCHHNPDPDSVGSALSMYQFLKSKSINCTIVCPNLIPNNLKFLPFWDIVQKIDFANFDFSSFDLFIAMDSASWNRISGSHEIPKPENIPFVVIDHHKTNHKFGEINYIEEDTSSNSEIIFKLFEKWNVEITPEIATTLLTGIIGDTGAFRFPEVKAFTFEVAQKLLSLGANKNLIIKSLYQSYSLDQIKYWTKILQNLKVENEGFVWSFVTKEIYQELNIEKGSKSEIADIFFQSLEGTKFGMVITEEEEGLVTVSFRAREDIDVSVLASKLGGGGHKWASAARILDLKYEDALNKILTEARKFSNE